MILISAMVVLAAAGQADTTAERAPVTLVCAGNGVQDNSTMKKGGGWDHEYTPISFTHKVTIEGDEPRVTFDGKPMAVWAFTDEEITFARDKKGRLNTLLNLTAVYTIDRQTGAFRYQSGSGLCTKVAQQKNLF